MIFLPKCSLPKDPSKTPIDPKHRTGSGLRQSHENHDPTHTAAVLERNAEGMKGLAGAASDTQVNVKAEPLRKGLDRVACLIAE